MDIKQYIPSGDPKKVLGTVVSVSVVLLVVWLFMVSRMEYRSESGTNNYSQEHQDSVTAIMAENNPGQSPGDRESSRIFMNALTTFVVLIVLLGLVWWWSRKKTGFSLSGKYFRDIGQHTVAPGSQLKILEVNEEIWILGISSGAVRLLHRYSKEEWKESSPSEPKSGDRSFYNMFSGKS